MKKEPAETEGSLVSDFLILADGTVFAHNLTPVMARVLAGLNPSDPAMQLRQAGEKTAPYEIRKTL